MKKTILKRIIGLVCALLLLLSPCAALDVSDSCRSAILIEANTGKVLYEQNADEQLPPASVTKVMTLLLVMEAIDAGKLALTDEVSVSANAASMGGSQVYLEPGETMSVEDMLKSVIISSANDAAVALAEHLCGTEEDFVARMNQRAQELGMVNTHFENTNGLDDTTENHVTSARDIAVMSAELLRHPTILQYSTIWMDTIRGGAFTLTNTNRLIRFYNGANGLKTGSTSRAKFCISASAKRGNLQLIAVIMAAPTRDIRNETAKKLLDYGFANYDYICCEGERLNGLPVLGSPQKTICAQYETFGCLTGKGEGEITREILLPETLCAPIAEGEVLGKIVYSQNGKTIGELPITACESANRYTYWELLKRTFVNFLTNA